MEYLQQGEEIERTIDEAFSAGQASHRKAIEPESVAGDTASRVRSASRLPIDDRVPDEQRREHRARRDLERLDEERAQQENHQDDREEALGIFDPPWFRIPFPPPFAKPQPVCQRNSAGRHGQQEQDQRKIQISPFRNTATKNYSASLSSDLENCEKSLLGNLYCSDLLHTPFPGLLLFQQLFLSGDIAPVTLCQHIFTQRLDGFPGKNMRADRCPSGEMVDAGRSETSDQGGSALAHNQRSARQRNAGSNPANCIFYRIFLSYIG